MERTHLAQRFLENDAKIPNRKTTIDTTNAMIRPVFNDDEKLCKLRLTTANAAPNNAIVAPTVIRVNIVKPIPPTNFPQFPI